VERARSIVDEKSRLIKELKALRERIAELIEECSKIEEKFIVVVVVPVVYRSTLVGEYTRSTDGKQYIEYRVWGHSNVRGSYPVEVLEEWMEKLLELFPPQQAGLAERIRESLDRHEAYEGDAEVELDEIAPAEAREEISAWLESEPPRPKFPHRVYGAATFTPWMYLAHQVDDRLEKLGETVIDPEAVDGLLRVFGVALPRETLEGRVRHYTPEQKRAEKARERGTRRR
jgi:hypothetical protein